MRTPVMDPSNFKDLGRHISPRRTLFNESDDDILFPDGDENFLFCESAKTTSLTHTSARKPSEQQPQANSETYDREQPHDCLTVPFHASIRDRS